MFLDGRPLEGVAGMVAMGREGGDAIRPVVGRIDPRGRYRIDTLRTGDGVAPGRYLVAVTAYRRSPSPASSAEGVEPPPEPAAVPEKYEDATTSGLTVEVTSEPRQTIDLQLKSK